MNKKTIIIIAILSFLILTSIGIAIAEFIPEGGTAYSNVLMVNDSDNLILDRMMDCKVDNNGTRHCVFERCVAPLLSDWDSQDMQNEYCTIMYKNDTLNGQSSNGSYWNNATNVSGEWFDEYGEPAPNMIDRNPVISIYQEKDSETQEIFIAWQRYEVYTEPPFWDAWHNWFSRNVDGNWTFEQPTRMVAWGQDLSLFDWDDLEIDCEHDEQGYVWCAWMSDWNTTCAGSFSYQNDDLSDCSWRLFSTKVKNYDGYNDWRSPANGTCGFGDLDYNDWFSYCAFPQIEPYNSTVDGTSSVHLVAEFYNRTLSEPIVDDEHYGQDVIYTNTTGLANLADDWGQFALVLADGIWGNPAQNGTAYARPRLDADRVGGDLQIAFMIHNRTITLVPFLDERVTNIRFIEMPNSYSTPSNIVFVTDNEMDEGNNTMPDVANDWRDTTTLGWITKDATGVGLDYVNYTNKSAYSNPDAWNPTSNASWKSYEINYLNDEHTPLTVAMGEGNVSIFGWHHKEDVIFPFIGITYNISSTSWTRNFTQPLCADVITDSFDLYGNVLAHNNHKAQCNDDGLNIQSSDISIGLSGYRVYGNFTTQQLDHEGIKLNSNDNVNVSTGILGFFGTGIEMIDSDNCVFSEIVNGVHAITAVTMTTNSDNNVFDNCTFQGSAVRDGYDRVYTNLYVNDSDNNVFSDVYIFNSRQGGAVVANPIYTNAYLLNAKNNTFYNASIYYTFAESKHIHTGVYMRDSNDNRFQNSRPFFNRFALLLNNTNDTMIDNNLFDDNNISITLLNASRGNIILNNTFELSINAHIGDVTEYSYHNLLLWNTSFGGIEWINQSNLTVVEGDDPLGLENNLNITVNNISFNSEYYPSLNDGGVNLTFYNTDALGFTNRTPQENGTNCTQCVELQDADTYIFNASNFCWFAVGEGGAPAPPPTPPFINVNGISPSNNSNICSNSDFCFLAVDSNSTTVNCTLFINDTWEWNNATVQNNTQTCATPNSTPLGMGSLTWYVNCSSDGEFNVTGIYTNKVIDCTDCPEEMMLAIFISLAIIAFVFAYLYVNSDSLIGYLWLTLAFACILIGLQSVKVISSACGCCGASSFASLYTGLYIALIITIIVIIFYMIYKFLFDRWLDRMDKEKDFPDEVEDDL